MKSVASRNTAGAARGVLEVRDHPGKQLDHRSCFDFSTDADDR
jgi:hypothetical protein